jgi:transcriptional regulator with PAS, ATPase and Fis domain
MQAKLLRVIQEKEFERLGSSAVIKIDARFIAASNRDIQSLISRKEFREDLFYRLDVFPINLPPLRKRKKDIPLLLDHFLRQNSKKGHGSQKSFSNAAVERLMMYGWPGNVRELQNIVERFYTISNHKVIDLKDIYTFFSNRGDERKEMNLKMYVSACEREHIQEVLDSVNGNRRLAAEILGIHRNTLLGKIKELGLT